MQHNSVLLNEDIRILQYFYYMLLNWFVLIISFRLGRWLGTGDATQGQNHMSDECQLVADMQ